ncbi:MAG: hypothetical protein MUF78_04775 [Candidatus Edwardsbacteria bacterium]|nr:hypothetical protein [Candidatus Edwardsbacteria bacterium]
MSGRWPRYAKLALAAVLLAYGIALAASPSTYRWLDRVDLIFHEAGHIIFMPFGPFICLMGGTLMQLIAPAAFVVYFYLRRSYYSATAVLFWLGQSLFNVSVYARDARARALPLLTGDEDTHDWYNMLSDLGLLRHDQAVGNAFYALGLLCLLAAVAGCVYFGCHETLPWAAHEKKQA